MPDHVQRFVEADPNAVVAGMVDRLKGAASHLLRTKFVSLRSRLSSPGSRVYYAGRVGAASGVVRQYIEGRERKK